MIWNFIWVKYCPSTKQNIRGKECPNFLLHRGTIFDTDIIPKSCRKSDVQTRLLNFGYPILILFHQGNSNWPDFVFYRCLKYHPQFEGFFFNLYVASIASTEGGVVAYPIQQAYGSPALEDNSEVGQAVLSRCSISCVCISAFQLPAKEANLQTLQWVLLRDNLVIFLMVRWVRGCQFNSRKDQLRKGLYWSWDTYSWILRPTKPQSKVGCMTTKIVCCVLSLFVRSGKQDFVERTLNLAQLMLFLTMDTVTESNR